MLSDHNNIFYPIVSTIVLRMISVDTSGNIMHELQQIQIIR